MTMVKCMLGLLVLLVVSGWTEARVVRQPNAENYYEDDEEEGDLTVSELLERANSRAVRGRSSLLMEGDIVMSHRRNANPCVQRGCMWPKSRDGKVYIPYVIANQFSPKDRDVISKAIYTFTCFTCIRFVPRTDERDYINFQSLRGCYSYLGRQGNSQTVSLSRPGCIYHGIIQHELLHALGFNHEQSRSDRDQHIRVLLHNVIPGKEHNFRKVNALNQGTPYDYGSVMHYSRTAFSKDRRSPTLEAVPNPNVMFGTAKQMSSYDIKRINVLYNC